jgi:response regulator RpfG family c-di-GMP phosphodiesterase
MPVRLRLADLLGSLSIVADLGFGLPPQTAMRSCLVGTALARELGVTQGDLVDTFYASLLLHVGCTAFSHEAAAALGDELTLNSAVAKTNFAAPSDVLKTLIPEATRGKTRVAQLSAAAFIVTRGKSFGHRHETASCEVARETARRLGLPSSLQRTLYQVHEWWKGGGAPLGLQGDEIALPARIARVAADAALFDQIGGAELAVDALRHRAGGMLDPSIIQVFMANAEALLSDANTGDPRERILEVEPEPVVVKDNAELLEVAQAFGDLADLKTPFTHGHSKQVATLARAAAETLRLDQATAAQLEVAALLHDLGRVGISNAIWEKPGPLTTAEWEQV